MELVQRELHAPELTLVAETILADDLELTVETLLLERTTRLLEGLESVEGERRGRSVAGDRCGKEARCGKNSRRKRAERSRRRTLDDGRRDIGRVDLTAPVEGGGRHLGCPFAFLR